MHPLFHPLYIEFCSYFNGNRDYFECHEALEEYWKIVAPRDRHHPLVGYIQIATGMYHWRRGNVRGAERMLMKGSIVLSNTELEQFTEKIDLAKLLEDVDEALLRIQKGQPFKPFEINVTDPLLNKQVQQHMKETPPLDESFIIHKHALRDRSEVIAERLQRLQEKSRESN